MSSINLSRRKFITNGATVLAGISALNMPLFGQNKNLKSLRLGLIGYGSRGEGITRLFKNVPNGKITAFCDNDPDRLEAAKKITASANFYLDHRKLLENKNIDAVIIATPLYTHYPIAVDAIRANKHVYLEKTMTYNITEALALVNVVRDSKIIFQVGHQYRNYAMYHKLKEIFDKGVLGTISHIECQYNRNADWRRKVLPGKKEKTVNWRLYKEYSGGLLAELNAHQIDIVNWFLNGHPNKVIGLGGIDYWKDGRTILDNVRVIYEYDNGIKSSVTSVSNNQHESYLIRMLGSKGTLEIKRDTAFIYPEQKKEYGMVDGVTGATKEALDKGLGYPIHYKSADGLNLDPTVYALIDFIECVNERKQPLSNVYTGKDAAIAVHMGNFAADTGRMQYWKDEYNADEKLI